MYLLVKGYSQVCLCWIDSPSSWSLVRPEVWTNTLFLWTVRKPLSLHWLRKEKLVLVEHWMTLLEDRLAPLVPVVGEYGAPRLISTLLITVRNIITKAARVPNLKHKVFGSKLRRFWQKKFSQ